MGFIRVLEGVTGVSVALFWLKRDCFSLMHQALNLTAILIKQIKLCLDSNWKCKI